MSALKKKTFFSQRLEIFGILSVTFPLSSLNWQSCLTFCIILIDLLLVTCYDFRIATRPVIKSLTLFTTPAHKNSFYLQNGDNVKPPKHTEYNDTNLMFKCLAQSKYHL